ncbi:MAG: hypothetical protein DRJ52_03230 [Thermoprotei archaeon]|nr:MAG: hypothetical protein DRJ52_03230 [Thermoprotei archaeon]HDI74914.1 hypothetical protein [Thermoprotei archaeon]
MKIYISADMEGIAGVVAKDHVSSTGRDYEKMRKYMTCEVSAAVRAALEEEAEYVLVNDSHGSMINLLLDELPYENVEIITGGLKPLLMMEGLDSSFSAAFFIGYHAKKHTAGAVLDHTISGRAINYVKINGVEVSEFYLNAAVAGHYGVPVALVTGDDKITSEAEKTIKNIEVVPVKYGISRYAARHIHPKKAQLLIAEAAKRALSKVKRGEIEPLKVKEPVSLEVFFTDSSIAEVASLVPGVKRVSGSVVRYEAQDVIEAYKLLFIFALLGFAISK